MLKMLISLTTLFIGPLILTLVLWIGAEICDHRADRAYRQQAYESIRQHHTVKADLFLTHFAKHH